MIFILHQFRKWVVFFFPESQPLRWLVLGPALLVLTILVSTPLVAHPLLPLIALVSFLAVWQRPQQGHLISMGLFASYSVLALLLGQGGWELILQEGAFILAVGVAALSFSEVAAYDDERKRCAVDEISTLKQSLATLEDKQAATEKEVEQQRTDFEVSLQEEREKVAAFSLLVEASATEAAKSFGQSETLSAQALQLQRDCTRLEQRLEEATQALKEVDDARTEEQGELAKRLEALNWYRVEYFQMQLFCKEVSDRLRKLKEFILQKKQGVAKAKVQREDKGPNKELKLLEEKKNQAKEEYDQELKEWQTLEEKIKQLQRKLDRASQVDEIDVIEQNKRRMKEEGDERKKNLKELKARYIDIEREIFLTRKELQHQGAFVV